MLAEKESILSILKQNRPAFYAVRSYENYLHESDFTHSGGLMLAIQRGDFNAVKYLIEKFGANPDLGRALSWPGVYCPLNAAIDKQNFEIIEYLLQKGADIFLSQNGVTPLSFLIQTCDKIKQYSVDRAIELWEAFDQYIKYLNQLAPSLLLGHEKEIQEFREFRKSIESTKEARSDSIVPNFASSSTRAPQSEHQKPSGSDAAPKSPKNKSRKDR